MESRRSTVTFGLAAERRTRYSLPSLPQHPEALVPPSFFACCTLYSYSEVGAIC